MEVILHSAPTLVIILIAVWFAPDWGGKVLGFLVQFDRFRAERARRKAMVDAKRRTGP